MTETELFSIFHDHHAKLADLMMDVIGINFAMTVAIFYFLNEAKLALKLFSFLAYSTGMILFVTLNFVETETSASALTMLREMPRDQLSLPSLHLIRLAEGWLPKVETGVHNLAYWVLWGGVAYLLFFWKKGGRSPAADAPEGEEHA
jgi:hypothetical protein